MWYNSKRGENTRLKVGFFVRGAAARFYLFPLRVFCFSFVMLLFFVPRLCAFVFVLSSLFLVFVRLLSLCLAFLFLSLLFYIVVPCFLYIYNIINNYLLYRLCVRMYAHARARQRRGKIRHKNRAAKKAALCMLSRNLLKYKSRYGLFSTRSRKRHYKRGASLPRLFRRR